MAGKASGASTPPWRDERGATATEYGLLMLLIALAILAGMALFGEALNDAYETWASAVGDVL